MDELKDRNDSSNWFYIYHFKQIKFPINEKYIKYQSLERLFFRQFGRVR